MSTSSKRKSPGWRSSVGVIYESNSRLEKSAYSYDQYHWWPTVFRVMIGVDTSSSRYRSRSDGRAKVIRTIAGDRVHIDSSSCLS